MSMSRGNREFSDQSAVRFMPPSRGRDDRLRRGGSALHKCRVIAEIHRTAAGQSWGNVCRGRVTGGATGWQTQPMGVFE